MAAPTFSSPFQPYVYQSQQGVSTAFQILGGESQIVQIMLRSQEKMTAKPGTICYTSGSIQMDNNYVPENDGGVLQWLFGRTVTSVVLFNRGPDVGFVGIASPTPGRILPIDLANFNGELLCQADTFLCSIYDVTFTNLSDPRGRVLEIGQEVFLKHKLKGQGLAFLVSGGSVVQKILEDREVLIVDVPSILAMTTSINFQLKNSLHVRRTVFGGENQLTATLTGPGVVFIQSIPFPRFSRRIARTVTSPNFRNNPRLLIQMFIFFVIAYIMIISSILLTDV